MNTIAIHAHSIRAILGNGPARQAVLHGVSLDIARGQWTSIVGPNGAGKSTLLAVLSGDIEPADGTVTLDGVHLAEHSARVLARRRAVLLQHQGLAFGFRVEEVVRMGRAPWHRTDREDDDDRVVAESLARADVSGLGCRHFPTLSGGEQGRTSFARVLAQETPIVLLDEPTSALDIRHQEALLSVARETARGGASVVVVLHDLSLAAAYADRVCVLSRGRVRAEGAPASVLTSALLTEVYEHPVDVIEHAGSLVVVPVRKEAPCVHV